MAIAAAAFLHAACGPVVFEADPDASPPADAAEHDGGTRDADAADLDAADAAADAAVADADAAVPSDFTVHVSNKQRDAIGVPVVFHDAFGRVLFSTATDRTGIATSTRSGSSMVTVVELGSGGADTLLQTVAGLEAGDRIELSIGNAEAQAEPHLLEIMPPGPVTDATRYQLDVGCGAVLTPLDPAQLNRVPISRSSFCVGTSSTVVALALAYDANDALLAFSLATNTISTTATTALVLPAWSTSFEDFELEMNDAPAEIYLLFSGLIQAQNGLELGPIDNAASSPGADATRMLRIPQLDLDRQLQVIVLFFSEAYSGLFEPTPRFGSSRSVELDTELLPQVEVSAVAWPTADRPRVSWSTARAAAIDAVGAYFFCPMESGYEWRLLFPTSQTSTIATAFELPALPESLAAARPRMSCDNQLIFELIDWDAVNGAVESKARSGTMSEQRRFRGRATERFRLTGRATE